LPEEEPPLETPDKKDEEEEEAETEGEEAVEQPPAAEAPKLDKRQKRINRLTRQKNEALEKLDLAVGQIQELQGQLQQFTQQGRKPGAGMPSVDSPLGNIVSETDLDKEVKSAQANLAWCDLNSEGVTNEHGEYIKDQTGRELTPEVVAEFRRANEQKILFAPQRRTEIQRFDVARRAWDERTVSYWPELADAKSPEYQSLVELLNSYPILQMLPQGNYAAGLMIEGAKVVMAKENQKKNGRQPVIPHRDISERAFGPRVPIAPSVPNPPSRTVTPSSRQQLNEAMSSLVKDSDGSAESLSKVFGALDKTRTARPSGRTPVKS
jgi:hypothetical protein